MFLDRFQLDRRLYSGELSSRALIILVGTRSSAVAAVDVAVLGFVAVFVVGFVLELGSPCIVVHFGSFFCKY